MELSQSDSGREIEISVNKCCILRLNSNPTTGFDWIVEESGEPFLQVKSSYEPSSSGLMGAGGVKVYEFTGKSQGEGKFRCEYKRHWEKVDPIHVFELTIRVK